MLVFFTTLSDGDFLFVDSSHTLGPAGEVTRIVMSVLPKLGDNVYIHFHDIWFPYDYPGTLFKDTLFFWHETALLMAFLAYNDSFCIELSLSMLHFERTSQLEDIISGYQPARGEYGIISDDGHYPSSLYLRRVKAVK